MNSERIILDRYRLDELLASGATAEVWRARDTQLDRDVAVKLLHPHLLPDAVSRARLTLSCIGRGERSRTANGQLNVPEYRLHCEITGREPWLERAG